MKRPLKKSHDLAAVKWAKVRATKGAKHSNNNYSSHTARTITKAVITTTIAMAMATKTYCKTETETETEN